MAWRVCTQPGCGTLVPAGTGRCPTHTRRRDGNPYSTPGHQAFREAVLARDPICVLCLRVRATVADHYPDERRDLVAQGLDPNDPARGRGLCKSCHDKHTAATSPGGWNTR